MYSWVDRWELECLSKVEMYRCEDRDKGRGSIKRLSSRSIPSERKKKKGQKKAKAENPSKIIISPSKQKHIASVVISNGILIV